MSFSELCNFFYYSLSTAIKGEMNEILLKEVLWSFIVIIIASFMLEFMVSEVFTLNIKIAPLKPLPPPNVQTLPIRNFGMLFRTVFTTNMQQFGITRNP